MSEFPNALFSAEHRLREPADHLRRFVARVRERLPTWEKSGRAAFYDAKHFVEVECKSGLFFQSDGRFAQHWFPAAVAEYEASGLSVTECQQEALRAFVTMMEMYLLTDESDVFRCERDRQGACDAAYVLVGEVFVAAAEATVGNIGTSAATNTHEPKRAPRGRPKADYETQQREAKLVAEWVRARDTGECKADFAKQNKTTRAEFEKLLGRVRHRKRRSDN